MGVLRSYRGVLGGNMGSTQGYMGVLGVSFGCFWGRFCGVLGAFLGHFWGVFGGVLVIDADMVLSSRCEIFKYIYFF